MTRDEIDVKTPLFGIGIKKENEKPFHVKDGEQYILKIWSWKKMRYIRKLISIHGDKVEVSLIE